MLFFRRRLWAARALTLACVAWLGTGMAGASLDSPARQISPAPQERHAEARLIEVYRLVGQARSQEALLRAEALVRDHPNFQLAQLVYGDLLMARARPSRPSPKLLPGAHAPATETLNELREESLLRLKALRERPPAGHVPAQFVQLSARNRHALAVDTSKARLYLFENTSTGLKLVADYYISVGKLGTGKVAEGDLRTPLGLYHITSNLEGKKLQDFYGAGALPLNYPNPYDTRRGKTGSGIWLHGTPPTQFARAPRASEGCIVLANPDLEHIMRTVEIRTTPVAIASSLSWVPPQSLATPETQTFKDTLNAWRSARASGDLQRLLDFYTPDHSFGGRSTEDSLKKIRAELERTRGRTLELKDLSVQRWTDTHDTMVVTFGEVPQGARKGPLKRQYWLRTEGQWKIFFEGVIS